MDEHERELRWGQSIAHELKRMITDGYLVVRSGSFVDGVHKVEYLWVDPQCNVCATFTEAYGKRLFEAAEHWGLATTKRYLRRKAGLLVGPELMTLLDESIERDRQAALSADAASPNERTGAGDERHG